MLAVLFAVAVARVVQVGNVLRVKGDETQSVGDEFIGEDGAVNFDFDQVYGNCRDFGLDYSSEGVCKGKVCL